MAFTTMRGPNLGETKLVFDKPVTTQPPADFSPLVIKADDAFIKGLHSYDVELNPPEKERYYYQNVMGRSFILNSSESMSIAGDRQSSAFDTDGE